MGVTGFLAGVGLVGLLIAVVPQLLLNAGIIWFVTNKMMDFGERTEFKKCILCAFLLWIVMVVGIVVSNFLGIIGVIAAAIIWYKGSIAAIEGSIETPSGALTIWILVSMVSVSIFALARVLVSA